MPHFECGAFDHSATSPVAENGSRLPGRGRVLSEDRAIHKAAGLPAETLCAAKTTYVRPVTPELFAIALAVEREALASTSATRRSSRRGARWRFGACNSLALRWIGPFFADAVR